MRDPDSGNSRGFGFISYDSFEASDSAIEVLSISPFKTDASLYILNSSL